MKYREIFNQNKNKIRNIIKLVTKEENEDLEQEVYLRALRAKDKYKSEGKLLHWLSAIAYNVSRNYLKSGRKRYETASVDDDEKFIEIKDTKKTPEEKILQKERQEMILRAINSLNKKHKEVIILSEIYNLPYAEISKKLNCPTGTVKSRVYTAKKELYEILKDLT